MTTDNTITITLDDVLGSDGLDGAWEGMTDKLANSAERKFLHSDADARSFHKACVDAINTAVTEKLTAHIDAALEKGFQPTDHYGNATGPHTSFNEMLGQAVETAMTEKVDSSGKPSRTGMTMFEHAIQRLALAGIRKAVSDEMRKVNTAAKEAISKEIAKAVAQKLAQGRI